VTTGQQAYHAAHLTPDPARAVLWQVLSEYLAPYIPPTAAVLELGAGYCDWINSVRAARKVALDVWDEMPRYAANDVQAICHDLSQGLDVLGDAKFDAVLASNLLEHFEPDSAARLAGDVFTRLNAGGRLILIQPNFRFAYRRYFDDYTHRSVFTDVSLPNLLRAHGFEIERVEARFTPYSLQGKSALARAWLIRLYLRSPYKPFAGQMLVIARKPEPRRRV
jgi:SAM-dependent methyltransferase